MTITMPALLLRTLTIIAVCTALLVTVVQADAARPAVALPVGPDDAALETAQRDAEVIASEVAAARARLATIEDEAAELAVRATTIAARLVELRSVVQAQAVERFVRGGDVGTATADLLLQGEGIEEAVRADVLARSITADSDAVLDGYRAGSQELARTREQLAELRRDEAEAVRELEQRAAAANAELARQVGLEAERVEADRLEVAGVLGGTGFLCPVDGALAFTNDWGQARSGGRRHQGTDMLSPRGTPVVASVGGIVSGHTSSLGGTSYTLTGDDGTTYYGTHLSSLSGASGRVERGTVLGYVGNSGNARGGPTHLHFEIRPGGGGAVNPYPTLAEHC